ncbi:hypothetical protein [Nocardioides jensenii]|uniref:hypothetical protein n=1 Tax=Nocardioides jensenii TaxID=1843 RepID=UPI000829A1B4|nr:hypothetical protein [Nocardioides jensenii]
MDGTEKTPRQITRAAYLDMIKAAGFDVDDTFSLRFATDGIYAEVVARDPETGERMVDATASTSEQAALARHTVYVKVTD